MDDNTIATHRRVCPLCEGMCGIKLSVANNHVVKVEPDHDNVWSQGHVCPKGTQLGALHHDADRLRQPVIRDGDQWRSVTWDEAFAHIETLVAGVRKRHGDKAFASYIGNMSGKGFASSRYMMLMLQQARFARHFSSSSVDQLPKNLSSHLMFGNMWKIPIPDIDNCDLMVIMGGNPAASKGSIFAHRDAMKGIRDLRKRGGKVIVIDPIKTKTAEQADQWLPINPGADAALLLAIAHVLFEQDRINTGHLKELLNGLDQLRALVKPYSPEVVADFCGLTASQIQQLAITIADSPRAAIYGRIGTCTQEFGTLASWLVDVIAIITGNLDRVGGSMWSTQVAPHLDLTPPYPSDAPVVAPPIRVRGINGVLGQYPASCLAEEIDTPGEGQIKGLVTLGSNPVLSAPGSRRLDAALPMLECMISLDIYINETSRHAHVILPSPSLLEQPHWDVWAWPWCLTSGGHYSPATIIATDRPDEWQVMTRLGAILGGNPDADIDALDDAYFGAMCDQVGIDRRKAMALMPEHGPERILDLCIRTGPFGDRFGDKPEGVCLQSFKDNPNGLLFGHAVPQGSDAISTPSGKIELAPEHITADLTRLNSAIANKPSHQLLLVSRRHLGSMNSWMHNIDKLVRGKEKCTLQIHPHDAQQAELSNGDLAQVSNATGSVEALVEITDSMRPGVVCLPHGWGHRDSVHLSVAKRHAGSNINELSPALLVDTPSGNAVLNGIPVELLKIA